MLPSSRWRLMITDKCWWLLIEYSDFRLSVVTPRFHSVRMSIFKGFGKLFAVTHALTALQALDMVRLLCKQGSCTLEYDWGTCTTRCPSMALTLQGRRRLDPPLSPSPSLPYSPLPHTYTSASTDNLQLVFTQVDAASHIPDCVSVIDTITACILQCTHGRWSYVMADKMRWFCLMCGAYIHCWHHERL